MPDPKMVDRVRSILAKADSTDYAPEATTARFLAQRLMDRHGITRDHLNPPVVQPPWAAWPQAPTGSTVYFYPGMANFTVTIRFG